MVAALAAAWVALCAGIGLAILLIAVGYMTDYDLFGHDVRLVHKDEQR